MAEHGCLGLSLTRLHCSCRHRLYGRNVTSKGILITQPESQSMSMVLTYLFILICVEPFISAVATSIITVLMDRWL